MKTNSREVFIRVQNIKEIIDTLTQIEKHQTKINTIIPKIEELKEKEVSILEGWSTKLDEIEGEIQHLTL